MDSVWWGAKESIQLRHAAGDQIRTGNYAAAEALFKQAADLALLHGDPVAAARYLGGVATARTMRFEYRGALQGYLEARALAVRSGDRIDQGSLALNLSSLYGQVWDLDSALGSAQQALEAVKGLPDVYYRAQVLLQLGRLHGELRDQDPEPFFEQGIEAARMEAGRTPDEVAVEARGWDLWGEQRLARGELAAAERAQMQAFFLRRLFVRRDLGLSYARLGALRLAQAEAALGDPSRAGLLQEAELFTQRAFEELARIPQSLPAYLLYYQRGRIRLAGGSEREALDDLETAVSLALQWRAEITPALSSLDGASSWLGERILDAFVSAAAAYGNKTGDRRLVEQSFQVAEISRAAGIQDSQALAGIWRAKLPTEYWATLGKLQAEESGIGQAGTQKEPTSRDLKLKLTEMEAQAGVGFSLNNIENFRSRDSLIHFLQGLRKSELVLSFDLGEKESFLWAVTQDSLNVYYLPPRGRVRDAIQRFRESVETGRKDTQDLGRQLYTMLFGQLRPAEARQPEWILSLEDALFELPFAALVPDQEQNGRSVYLSEVHSVQVVPGALLLDDAPSPQNSPGPGRLLAIEDPIYNVADSRWDGANSNRLPSLRPWFAWALGGPAGQLNRLPGTAREVESSLGAWTGSQTILKGPSARRDAFLRELSPVPSTIHLATHVLTPSGRRDQAFLAFGVGANGRSELMAPSDVAMLRVPGSLVVMTGCSTAASDPRAGAGLAGLTRAWLMAGARAVVATQWPVKDFTGEILSKFYGHLRYGSPAQALRQSQVDMIHSGTASSAPAAWASYQLFGAVR